MDFESFRDESAGHDESESDSLLTGRIQQSLHRGVFWCRVFVASMLLYTIIVNIQWAIFLSADIQESGPFESVGFVSIVTGTYLAVVGLMAFALLFQTHRMKVILREQPPDALPRLFAASRNSFIVLTFVAGLLAICVVFVNVMSWIG